MSALCQHRGSDNVKGLDGMEASGTRRCLGISQMGVDSDSKRLNPNLVFYSHIFN